MRFIILSKGMVATVSSRDYARLNKFKWHASQESRGGRKFYAVRWVRMIIDGKKRRVKIRMHREILGLPPGILDPDGLVVDHKNGNGLDNFRSNLKAVTQLVNMSNTNHKWKKKKVECFL